MPHSLLLHSLSCCTTAPRGCISPWSGPSPIRTWHRLPRINWCSARFLCGIRLDLDLATLLRIRSTQRSLRTRCSVGFAAHRRRRHKPVPKRRHSRGSLLWRSRILGNGQFQEYTYQVLNQGLRLGCSQLGMWHNARLLTSLCKVVFQGHTLCYCPQRHDTYLHSSRTYRPHFSFRNSR